MDVCLRSKPYDFRSNSACPRHRLIRVSLYLEGGFTALLYPLYETLFKVMLAASSFPNGTTFFGALVKGCLPPAEEHSGLLYDCGINDSDNCEYSGIWNIFPSPTRVVFILGRWRVYTRPSCPDAQCLKSLKISSRRQTGDLTRDKGLSRSKTGPFIPKYPPILGSISLGLTCRQGTEQCRMKPRSNQRLAKTTRESKSGLCMFLFWRMCA